MKEETNIINTMIVHDCDDDLDFNTLHSLVDHEEMNTLEETSIHERLKRLWNPNPRYNDYVLY